MSFTASDAWSSSNTCDMARGPGGQTTPLRGILNDQGDVADADTTHVQFHEVNALLSLPDEERVMRSAMHSGSSHAALRRSEGESAPESTSDQQSGRVAP